MTYIGDISLGDTIDIKFCTVQATGAPTTLLGSPAVAAYPDNSTTEITAGITLSVDFDSRTGLNNVRVVASGGNGYAAGSNYQLVITAGTVNGVSVVGYVVAQFSIQARSALRPATAGRTLVVDANGLADANMVKAGPSGSGTAQTTGDIFARLGAPAGASVSADIAMVASYIDTEVGAIKAKTDNLPGSPAAISDIPTANQNADALLDRANGIETGLTVRNALRDLIAVLLGELTGAATAAPVFKSVDLSGGVVQSTKSRVTGAGVDSNGNRGKAVLDHS